MDTVCNIDQPEIKKRFYLGITAAVAASIYILLGLIQNWDSSFHIVVLVILLFIANIGLMQSRQRICIPLAIAGLSQEAGSLKKVKAAERARLLRVKAIKLLMLLFFMTTLQASGFILVRLLIHG